MPNKKIFLDHDKEFKYFFIPLNIIILLVYYNSGAGSHINSLMQYLMIPFQIIFIPISLLLLFGLILAVIGFPAFLLYIWISSTYEDQETPDIIDQNLKHFGGFLLRIVYAVFIFAMSIYFMNDKGITDLWYIITNLLMQITKSN